MAIAEQPTGGRGRGRPSSGGREAILDAALALVREKGIANLTSREVAARAGVSDASVYYHFRDRSGLVKSTFEHGIKPLWRFTQVPPGMSDPAEVMRSAFESLKDFFDTVVPIMHAAQSDPELRRVLAEFMDETGAGPHRGVSVLGDFLRSEQALGRVRADADVDAIALLVINCAFAESARKHMEMHDESRLPAGERLLDQLQRLLEPDGD